MEFDHKKLKQIYRLVIFCALLILAIIYIKDVLTLIEVFFGILMPFIIGGVIAFVLNIPLRVIENKLLKKWTGKSAKVLKRPISIFLSILLVTLIVFVVLITVVPQLTTTVTELGKKIPTAMEELGNYINDFTARFPQINKYFGGMTDIHFDWDSVSTTVFEFLKSGVSDVITSTFGVAMDIVGIIVNLIIGFIFAIYLLGQKEKISDGMAKMMRTYLKPGRSEKILKVARLLNVNFVNFFTGQCIEAVILGCMFVITMLIFQIPYAVMLSILIAFTSLIPIVGAFIGCIVGILFILVDSPSKVLVFLILFLIIQQVEENVIYPKVVGNKVGLPSILVLMAVTIGGSMFGVAGMLVFIPLVSTVYTLAKERTAARGEQQQELNSSKG